MMNPNNLICNEIYRSNTGQSCIGVAFGNGNEVCFSLYPVCGKNAKVSSNNNLSDATRKAFVHEAKESIKLKDFLKNFDIEFTSKNDCDIDLSIENITKNTFIDLFKL